MESAIDGLLEFRQWANPELRKLASDENLPATDRFRSHLALIEIEPDSVDYVVEQLLRITPPDVLDFDELALGTDLLAKVDAMPKSRLVDLATDTTTESTLRFRALFMLARTAESAQDSDDLRWDAMAEFVVDHLVEGATASPRYYRTLVDAFLPVRSALFPAFRTFLANQTSDQSEQFTAALIVGEYATDQPEYLCDLLFEVQPEPYTVLLQHLQKHRDFVKIRFQSLLASSSNETDEITAETTDEITDETTDEREEREKLALSHQCGVGWY